MKHTVNREWILCFNVRREFLNNITIIKALVIVIIYCVTPKNLDISNDLYKFNKAQNDYDCTFKCTNVHRQMQSHKKIINILNCITLLKEF